VHGAWPTLLAAVDTLRAIGADVLALPVIDVDDSIDGDEGNGRI
jgi:hypothetical protein